jgi:hypothetical protein
MRNAVYILILFVSTQLFAQVGDIKQASSTNTRADFGRGSGGGSCFVDIGLYMLTGGIRYHKDLMQNKEEVFQMVSINAKANIGSMPGYNTMFIPQIRGNWGLFSTDIRNFFIFEQDANASDSYSTLDWQIIQLNLVQIKDFNLRIGTGISYERFSEKVYNENSLAMDGFLNNNKYTIGGEIRYAHDYFTRNIYRMEGNIAAGIRFLEMKNQKAYFNMGLLYQNYFLQVNNWGIKGGIDFYFHK